MNNLAGANWKGIFAIVLGLALILWPDVALNYIVIFVGVVLLATGVISLVAYASYRRRASAVAKRMPVGGAIELLVGLALVIFPAFFVNALMVVLGVLLILAAVGQIAMLTAAQRDTNLSFFFYLFPILILIAGVVVLFNPFASAAGLFVFFGVTAIFYGVVDLFNIKSIRGRRQ